MTDPVRNSLPDFAVDSIVEAMPHLGRKLCGFDAPEAVMKAVETRSSSPVRILRDESGQSSIGGLFPAGEGPGYAGGDRIGCSRWDPYGGKGSFSDIFRKTEYTVA